MKKKKLVIFETVTLQPEMFWIEALFWLFPKEWTPFEKIQCWIINLQFPFIFLVCVHSVRFWRICVITFGSFHLLLVSFQITNVNTIYYFYVNIHNLCFCCIYKSLKRYLYKKRFGFWFAHAYESSVKYVPQYFSQNYVIFDWLLPSAYVET